MNILSKTEINLLKAARTNCLINVEQLLWGKYTVYSEAPTNEEIEKANKLLKTVDTISAMIAGNKRSQTEEL